MITLRTILWTSLILFTTVCTGESQSRDSSCKATVQNSSRCTVIISDLHMGIGRQANNSWRPQEDFRWANQFVAFLKKLDELSDDRTDLVLNGDTFELWESISDDCRYEDVRLGCTEKEAKARLEHVIKQHRPELHALGAFARAKDHRVILVPGNHDAALLFPTVRALAESAILKDQPKRVMVATEGFWLSPDAKIYAEHGHQINMPSTNDTKFEQNRRRKQPNGFAGWPKPFASKAGKQYLERPPAEQKIQAHYNKHESNYPLLDNFVEEPFGIRYRLQSSAADPATAYGDFVEYLLFQVVWKPVGGLLGSKPGESPQWDLAAAKLKGTEFWLKSLPAMESGDPLAAADPSSLISSAGLSMDQMDDEALQFLCDKRALLRAEQRELHAPDEQLIEECPKKDAHLGKALNYLLRSRDELFKQHLTQVYDRLKTPTGPDPAFHLFVYGHTHAADSFSLHMGDWTPTIVNAGAWQRVFTMEEMDQVAQADNLKPGTLTKRDPENLPENLDTCFSFLLVPPSAPQKDPEPMLLYWMKQGTNWKIAEFCQQ